MSDVSDQENVAVLPCEEIDSHETGAPDAEVSTGPSPRPSQDAPTAARLRAVEVIRLTIGFALLSGLVESAYYCFRRVVLGRLIFQGQDILAMVPVAYLLMFAIPGLLLLLSSRRMPRQAALALTVVTLGWLAWLNVLFFVPGLHWGAYLLLAGGLAVGTGRLVDRHTDGFMRLARRGTYGLVLVVCCGALVSVGGSWLRERNPQSTIKDAPNVLLIVLDTVRSDVLGPYGLSRGIAPRLAQYAREGTVFDYALASSPWTLPSHATMFTSRLPHELSGDWLSPINDDFPTLAERLGSQGYQTAGFVGNTRYCSAETGLARGFVHYEDYGLSLTGLALRTNVGRKILFGSLPAKLGYYNWPGRKTAEEVNAALLTWLSTRDRKPFFAFVNYWDAHDPYLAPAPFDEHVARNHAQGLMIRRWWWMDKKDVSPQQLAFVRGAYDDCVRHLDHQLGRLLDELRRRGVLQNTILIITSDHGEHFGEHGLLLHGNSLYEPVLHVPLVIVAPGRVPEKTQITTPVGLDELPATVMDLTGLSEEGARGEGLGAREDGFSSPNPSSLTPSPSGDEGSPFLGRSLSRFWQEAGGAGGPKGSPIVSEIATQAGCPPNHGRSPVARGPMKSILLGDVKFIGNGDHVEEVYNIRKDPRERKDLIGEESLRAVIGRLRKLLTESVGES